MKKVIFAAAAVMALAGCGTKKGQITMLPYPETRRDTTVVDNYHGTMVSDPYRWLEDDNSAETKAWVEAQNKVTFDYLGQIPYREQVRARLTQLWNYPKEGVPEQHGEWFYFGRNNGLQNQGELWRGKTADGKGAELFLDPNKFSTDGTAAMSATSFSDDGKYFAYALSKAGSDWVEIFVVDTDTKEQLSDVIKWSKFSGATWAADSKGFYYSAYDAPAAGEELKGKNEFQTVYYHKIGTPQSEDTRIYRDEEHPLRYFSGGESTDGKYIFITGTDGTHGTEILYRETAGGDFKVLLPGFENDYTLVDAYDGAAYFYTNDAAPNYRVMAVNLNTGEHIDFIPENKDALLQSAEFVGGYVMATYLENAQSAVMQFSEEGSFIRRVELPAIGTTSGFVGEKECKQTYYAISTYTAPPTIYTFDLAGGTSTVLKAPQINFNADLYTTEQVFFTSKDGTQVPMFIVHRKDMKLDGSNPLMLYGYGGFNVPLTPGYSPSTILLLEQGGVYVQVSLRGGAEYGEEWHRAGMLEKKQNVFDDFIGAAEYLVAKGYTSPSKLAINGGSNGGLLVGACMVQRPDLFAVAIPQVGVLDMLRFHRFTVGWGWVAEYGSADVAEQFPYIYKYSPLHNMREGVCYPATLITTGDHDDRVVPAHSFKFAAQLQAVQACERPTLIRIDSNAGHGAGKPTSKRIDEAADIYSFTFWNTGTQVKY